MLTRRVALRLVLAVILAAGAVHAARFAVASRSSRSVYNLAIDTALYDDLAWTLAQTGDVTGIPPSQPPGFIVLLATVYAVFGHSYLAAKLMLCAMLVLTAALASRTAWTELGPLEGLIAGAATVWSPLLVAYAATLQYEIPAAFLSTVIMTLVMVAGRREGAKAAYLWPVMIAAICAGAALVREVLLVLFPIALAALTLRPLRCGSAREAVVVAVLMTGVFMTPIAAWSYVQWQHTGRLVLISDKAGVNLRIGNNPAANGTYHLQLEPVAEPSGGRFLRERPRAAAALAIRKVMYFWGLARDPWTVPNPFGVTLSRALGPMVPFTWPLTGARGGIVAGLFLAGAVLLRTHPRAWVLPIVVLAVMAVHILYFSSQRFSVPVYPQMLICAAAGAAALVRGLTRHRAGRVIGGLVLLWTIVAQTFWRPGSYVAEAASLEGLSAVNRPDPAALNGRARFGDSQGGPRPIAFFVAETFPRGAFLVRLRVRAESCGQPSEPALVLVVRDGTGEDRVKMTASEADVCSSGRYTIVEAVGVLRDDDTLDLSINTTGATGLWVDRVEILAGYRRRLDVPDASGETLP